MMEPASRLGDGLRPGGQERGQVQLPLFRMPMILGVSVAHRQQLVQCQW